MRATGIDRTGTAAVEHREQDIRARIEHRAGPATSQRRFVLVSAEGGEHRHAGRLGLHAGNERRAPEQARPHALSRQVCDGTGARRARSEHASQERRLLLPDLIAGDIRAGD